MREFIELLNKDLECIDYKIELENQKCVVTVKSTRQSVVCPYCGMLSSKVHSTYKREIQDIPFEEFRVILNINARKMFCENPECKHTTFAERFDFVGDNGKKTHRLVSYILDVSEKLSSVTASEVLKSKSIETCKSSICNLRRKTSKSKGESFGTEAFS